MGAKAPITDQEARLILATESANRALGEQSNVFDEATYSRIRLCKLSEPPECLARIVNLSKRAKNAPRSRWSLLEADHKDAFTDFLAHLDDYLHFERGRFSSRFGARGAARRVAFDLPALPSSLVPE